MRREEVRRVAELFIDLEEDDFVSTLLDEGLTRARKEFWHAQALVVWVPA